MKSAAYPIHEVSFRVQRSDVEFSLGLPAWALKYYFCLGFRFTLQRQIGQDWPFPKA